MCWVQLQCFMEEFSKKRSNIVMRYVRKLIIFGHGIIILLNVKFINQSTMHFLILKAPCETKWIIKYGSYSPGGHLNPFVRTALDCLQACIDDLTCVGVDVDSSGSSTTCMVHSTIVEYLQIQSDSRYSQYRISTRCPIQSLPSELPCVFVCVP